MKKVFCLVIACAFVLLSVPVYATEQVYDSAADDIVSGDVTINAETVILNTEADTNSVALFANNSSPLMGGYFIDCTTSQLGDIRLYVPYQYVDGYFTLTDTGNIFNLSSGTITCVCWTSSGVQYTVRFSSFSTPEYRDISSSSYYDWYNLTVSQISDTNVRILEDNPQVALDINFVYLFIIFALLVVILCQFMKR